MNPLPEASPSPKRALHVALALAIGVAFAGYFVGTTAPRPPVREAARPVEYWMPHAPEVARSYAELRASRPGPNAGWRSHIADLATPQPDLLEEITVSDADKRAALAERAALRAYNGAPPVIPHAIDQLSASNCLACHGEGLKIGARVAARISHAHLANCTQCHVPGDNRQLQPAIVVANVFDGVAAPWQGERAYPGAPPTIPHTTHMRSDCLSCHGPTGRLGIRSTHPWRASCTQCHAPSARLDQYAFSDVRSGTTAP